MFIDIIQCPELIPQVFLELAEKDMKKSNALFRELTDW